MNDDRRLIEDYLPIEAISKINPRNCDSAAGLVFSRRQAWL